VRLVIAVLVLLTVYLQYALWVTRGGIPDVDKLKRAVAEQKDDIARLKERNRSLGAEVMDLKQGMEAVEERSRSEMGMIKRGEVFFRITDPKHEHDLPQHGGGAAHGAEPPLEPPLDPLVAGDPLPDADLDAPPAPTLKPPLQASAPAVKTKPSQPRRAAPLE
jgi:cell division protein FtsB